MVSKEHIKTLGAINLKAKIKQLDKKTVTKYLMIALFVLVAIYCSVVLVGNYSDISKLRAEAAEAKVKYHQQVKENEKIEAVLNSKNKDSYIEKKAREKGYAKDGETVFYDISSSK